MKIHEYQAKAILARYGVPVPRGEVAFNATEAGEIARRLGGSVVVVVATHRAVPGRCGPGRRGCADDARREQALVVCDFGVGPLDVPQKLSSG